MLVWSKQSVFLGFETFHMKFWTPKELLSRPHPKKSGLLKSNGKQQSVKLSLNFGAIPLCSNENLALLKLIYKKFSDWNFRRLQKWQKKQSRAMDWPKLSMNKCCHVRFVLSLTPQQEINNRKVYRAIIAFVCKMSAFIFDVSLDVSDVLPRYIITSFATMYAILFRSSI